MFDALGEYLFKEHPEVFFFILAMIIGFIVIGMFFNLKNKLSDIKNNSDKVPGMERDHLVNMNVSANIEKKLDNTLLPKMEKMSEGIILMNINIGVIASHIAQNTGFDKNLIQSNSPITLTQIGESLLTESNGREFVDSFKEKLITELESKKPQTQLDVENQARVVLNLQTNSSEFNKVKEYIYNNPVYKANNVNVNISLIIYLMAIYLRDKYFDIHPELKKD